MLTLLLLVCALSLSSGAPAVTNEDERVRATLFGRQLPDSVNIAQYRTKQEILLSCLATVFACTWVAVHPNLPGPWDSGRTKLKRRIVTMVYALLAPEFMAMWAFRQWIAARRIAKELNEADSIVAEEGSCWQILKSEIEEWFYGPYRNAPRTWTITHGFFVQMGGFHLCEGRTPKKVLKVDDLKELIRQGEMPDITEEDIDDKSKGDFLTKLLVVLQATWFVFQCAARWVSNLPVTELEVITLAFAVLNVMTYVLWWKKPQSVVVAVRIQQPTSEDESHEDVEAEAEELVLGEEPVRGEDPEESWIGRKLRQRMHGSCPVFTVPLYLAMAFLRPLEKMAMGSEAADEPLRVSMFSADHKAEDKDLVPFMWISVLFGALHLIPWSFQFPSTVELWLWRSSALVITIEPLTLVLSWITHDGEDSSLIAALGMILILPSLVVGLPLYMLARLILLGLAFATLRDLPPGAYANIEWTTFIPHL